MHQRDRLVGEMPWVIPDVMAVAGRPTPKPLPLAALIPSTLRSQLTYAVARIDRSGRMHDQVITGVAGWRSGDTLSMALTDSYAVFHPDPRGLITVTRSKAVSIPAVARHQLMIEVGDRVLLAAHSGHGLIIAYPLATLDRALADFHSRQSATP
ncbi:AbrB/MazE/SpoVT family DNA-binding domain-containing protein [Amycolatopsis sp. CA-128772]|uniref:AbrB/MazE/SpoVT family DNA-binding domain-containing protein n=1 Tax=Amycolatopsis sp. CA-128772 TaxID=2073159 RepID=UPI0011B00EBF|nr:AbrB/MazE/SpoVT family DNA-binding domain-containing protein [Amycolatopsis sp. CA-128772]